MKSYRFSKSKFVLVYSDVAMCLPYISPLALLAQYFKDDTLSEAAIPRGSRHLDIKTCLNLSTHLNPV